MTESIEDQLRAQVLNAFSDVTPPPPEDMLQKVYASNDDAIEMKLAFQGKHWTEIPISVLSHHREIVIALSGIGYRAYLPAYLTACVANDQSYGPDIRGYTLYGLRPLSRSDVHVATAQERLSLLNDDQRTAVASVLRYLDERWHMVEASDVLRDWQVSSGSV